MTDAEIPFRVGQAFDIHAQADDPDRVLILGGVAFDGARGLAGHSDAVSSGLRTPTRFVELASRARSTSVTSARSEVSASWAPYSVAVTVGTSTTSFLSSSFSHFTRPPFMSRTSRWP